MAAFSHCFVAMGMLNLVGKKNNFFFCLNCSTPLYLEASPVSLKVLAHVLHLMSLTLLAILHTDMVSQQEEGILGGGGGGGGGGREGGREGGRGGGRGGGREGEGYYI